MPSKNKARGNALERELVKLAQAHGHTAQRAWGSNGQAMGEAEDVDVRITTEDKVRSRIQCKRRKALPAYLQIPESCDAVYFRQDRGPGMILLRVEDWLASL